MWKPADVIPQHRGRAVVIFVGLTVALAAYTGYLIFEAVKKMEKPSTSFKLSNDLYTYPDVYVCFYEFYGCDTQDLEEECALSVSDTAGGEPTAVFNPNGANEQPIRSEAILTDEKGWCVVFFASEVEIPTEGNPEDYILLSVSWYPGGSADGSNTCISEEGMWESHSESVFVTLRDASTEVYSAGIQVGYSCVTEASNSHVFSFMGIGRTEEKKLGNERTASYKALTTSSVIYKDKRNADFPTGSPYAWLSMEIAQSQDSLETITEINPLEIAEIFGNIGGFWEILLFLWPLFFVAASRNAPSLKARSFKSPLWTSARREVELSGPVEISPPWSRRGELDRPSKHLVAHNGETV